MTFQTTSPLTHQSLQASSRQAREVARMIDEQGDLAPSYQRASVWGPAQRMGLIRSWMVGVPVPAVVINDRYESGWPQGPDGFPIGGHGCAVVDGKQRIETARAWFTGVLQVPASWFPTDDVLVTTDTDDGPYVSYLGLSDTARRLFANRALLPVIEAHLPTIEAEAELYLLLNGAGTPQTDADLANAAHIASGDANARDEECCNGLGWTGDPSTRCADHYQPLDPVWSTGVL